MTPLIIAGLAVFGILSILGIIVWIIVRREDQRNKDLLQTATSMGFTSLAALPDDLKDVLSRVGLMNTGRNRIAWNIFQKNVDGFDLLVFDYQYAIGGGKSQQVPQQTVALFRSERIQTPRFQLKPESWQSKLIEAVGGQDIDFEEAVDFSKKYVLQGDDESAIRQFFNSLRLQSLTSFDHLCLESQPGCFLFWFDRTKTRPEGLHDFVEQASKTCQLMC